MLREVQHWKKPDHVDRQSFFWGFQKALWEATDRVSEPGVFEYRVEDDTEDE